jgi:hypothetical protein
LETGEHILLPGIEVAGRDGERRPCDVEADAVVRGLQRDLDVPSGGAGTTTIALPVAGAFPSIKTLPV